MKEKEREEKGRKRAQKEKEIEIIQEQLSSLKLQPTDISCEDEDDCPVCHIKGLSCQWICCDNYDTWYHTQSTEINPNVLPESFHCSHCV